jgi:hypothetical protein
LVEAVRIKRREWDGGYANLGGQPFAEVGFAQVFFGYAQFVDAHALKVAALTWQ